MTDRDHDHDEGGVEKKDSCPLCGADDAELFASIRDISYLRCPVCHLTFMHPDGRLGSVDERRRYEMHENDPSDAGYRAFLDRLREPLLWKLPRGARGLDYGSGPGPTLSVMMAESGFETDVYDPFFAPHPSALQRTYDFITCTEVVEHLFHPGAELERLDSMLRPGGWLGVMTTLLDDEQRFEEWWYARDPTHVAFFRSETMEWIARAFGWALERPGRNVALFQKADLGS